MIQAGEPTHVQDNDRCRRTGSRPVYLSKSGRYDAVAYLKALGSMFNLVESPHQHLSPREDTHVPCPIEYVRHSGGILVCRDTMREGGHVGNFRAATRSSSSSGRRPRHRRAGHILRDYRGS